MKRLANEVSFLRGEITRIKDVIYNLHLGDFKSEINTPQPAPVPVSHPNLIDQEKKEQRREYMKNYREKIRKIKCNTYI
ncbi:MAG: recombination protein RecB [Qinghai Lake virophage]|uniref:Recombination protein RecB n=1 Tax=Qinghai Lake virophage TaxID=1516115 RepID=A0A0R5K4Y5_9VIRU|nr:MAG: recombination protein RecB [Qinghai Lake virophage]